MSLPPRSESDIAQRAAWDASSLRFLYLDLNSFFASVEQQDNPALRGKPIIVVPVESDTTSAIAASIEAKTYGIKTGTPVWEAKQKYPGIGIVNARHDRYVEVHELVEEEVDRHIPVFKTWSIDEVSCELIGPERLKDNAIALSHRLRAGLRDNPKLGECIRCSIGIAPNQFLAKLASDMQKPDGLTIIEKHELPERILPLALRDLPGIGANMEQRLNDAGITTIAELWDMNPRDARRIWGSKEGPAFIQRIRGIGDYSQSSATRSISHEHVLPPQNRDEESAYLILRRLGVKGGARLRRMGFVASNLGAKVRFDDDTRWAADFRITQTQDTFVILDAITRLWEQMLRETGGGRRRRRYMKVGMWLTGLTPRDEVTLDLFGGASGLDNDDAEAAAKRAKLWAAMDKLNQKYDKKDTVRVGPLPKHKSDFMGAKIAFNRIPKKEEFKE